jgi:hypothetical protein
MDTGVFGRSQGYLGVFDPTLPYEPKYRTYKDLDDEKRRELLLWEHNFGDPEAHERPFGQVGLAKGFASWKTGLPSYRIVTDAPYLMEEGWTIWGGSAVLPGGLVTLFSGVAEYQDEFISEIMGQAIRVVTRDIVLHPETGIRPNKLVTFLGEDNN